jgi:hypothetical protein
LEAARPAEVVVTSLEFGPGRPTGVSLALMTLTKRPDIKVLFVGPPHLVQYTWGFGEFLPVPFRTVDLVQAVNRLAQARGET